MNQQVAARFRLMSEHEREKFTADCIQQGLTAHQTDLLENHICGRRAGQSDAGAKLIGHFLKWPNQADAAINIFTKYTNRAK